MDLFFHQDIAGYGPPMKQSEGPSEQCLTDSYSEEVHTLQSLDEETKYWCYYLQRSRNLVSSVYRIFTKICRYYYSQPFQRLRNYGAPSMENRFQVAKF